jgi:predicted ATPase
MKPQVISVKISGEMKDRINKEEIFFKPGPNVIIGENGSGKSSLFQVLLQPSKEIKETCKVDSIAGTYYAFDFEKDNPRKKGFISEMSHITSRFVSHGQSNQAIIKCMTQDDAKNCMFFLDEPEQALDINGLKLLISTVEKSKASQILIITHHPFIILNPIFNVIELTDEYYDSIIKFTKQIYFNIKDKIYESRRICKYS